MQSPSPDDTMHLTPLGDSCVLIELGDAIGAAAHARVMHALRTLDDASLPWVVDVVPAFTSLAVHYDAAALAGRTADPWTFVTRHIADALAAGTHAVTQQAPRTIEIPVRYGGADGPDLENVARMTSLAADDVVALHCAAEYRVYMIGFAPGFPYMAGLPAELEVPRHATPRTRVPAGSVGIAGRQSGIYPLETPGGWQIIGRTDVRLFTPEREPPVLLAPGGVVRFVAT